jgi:hypothetical protein
MPVCFDQADIHPAFHSRTSNRVNEFRKNQNALCIVWQYAFNSHVCVVVPSKFAKGKKGQAGRVNCFDHCIASSRGLDFHYTNAFRQRTHP